LPEYSDRTQAVFSTDHNGKTIIAGYAFISTKIVDTPFILMVIKQKGGMIAVWQELHLKITWIVGLGIMVILAVIVITCSFMVNKMFLADKAKAEMLAMVEENNQLAAIGQLAAGVAHEINNPLALINETAGYVKDLFVITETYRRDDELMEHIDSILEAVERCGQITKQLLGFARKFDLQTQKVNVKEVITDVLNFHRKEAIYRSITIDIDLSEEDLVIESDQGKLQQILLNLTNNAFQALNDGCRLEVSAAQEGSDNVLITIRDNGCGMSEELLPRIFSPFFTTKERGKGTGLGLAITHGLVKKLHGKISVESKVNEGTTFYISLPKRIKKEPGKK
jgi:signal transduction histidine kinase